MCEEEPAALLRREVICLAASCCCARIRQTALGPTCECIKQFQISSCMKHISDMFFQNGHTRPREANMMLCGTAVFASDIKVLVEFVSWRHENQGNAAMHQSQGASELVCQEVPGAVLHDIREALSYLKA